jgi:hypothetical protein
MKPGQSNPAPIGHAWLRANFAPATIAPYTESYVVAGARRIEMRGPRTTQFYPRIYATGDDIAANLRFALRYEPLDLAVLVAAFEAMPPETITDWVRAEPTGAYARRAWFLVEHLTGRTLDLPDVTAGKYVPALDPAKHLTGLPRNSPRHRVTDNLLGTPLLCPTIRRTAALDQRIASRIDEEVRALVEPYDAAILARATHYLYTKETRSSFAIEGETPSATRTERFVAALRAASRFDPSDPAAILRLQNAIVDPRYAATGWRDFQNFVGETTVGFGEQVHFLCPQPGDVASLMQGWMDLLARMIADHVDPVATAAIAAFAFVFIHPFEDGNGRIHRFLIHHVLSRTGFSPGDLIFPVSAAIMRDQRSYDAVLETFSQPLLALLDWDWTPAREIVIRGETAPHYRCFDATLFAEYLYDRVADTVRTDLRAELGFLATFDRATFAVREIVDIPDRRAALLIRLIIQNGGTLSRTKRAQFAELSDPELAAIEAAVQAATASGQEAETPDPGS